MNNTENNPPTEQRSLIQRIWNPMTPGDENLIRIFFWVSIIICLLLPNVFKDLVGNKTWEVITIAWLATAFFIRFRIYFRR